MLSSRNALTRVYMHRPLKNHAVTYGISSFNIGVIHNHMKSKLHPTAALHVQAIKSPPTPTYVAPNVEMARCGQTRCGRTPETQWPKKAIPLRSESSHGTSRQGKVAENAGGSGGPRRKWDESGGRDSDEPGGMEV